MDQITELYMTYKSEVFSYLISLTRDKNLADDLTSETFLQAISALNGYKGESSVKTWLFGIARNLWLRELKKNRLVLSYEDLLSGYIVGAVPAERDAIADTIHEKQVMMRIIELLDTKQSEKTVLGKTPIK